MGSLKFREVWQWREVCIVLVLGIVALVVSMVMADVAFYGIAIHETDDNPSQKLSDSLRAAGSCWLEVCDSGEGSCISARLRDYIDPSTESGKSNCRILRNICIRAEDRLEDMSCIWEDRQDVCSCVPKEVIG